MSLTTDTTYSKDLKTVSYLTINDETRLIKDLRAQARLDILDPNGDTEGLVDAFEETVTKVKDDIYGNQNMDVNNVTSGSVIGQAQTATKNANNTATQVKKDIYGNQNMDVNNVTSDSVIGQVKGTINQAKTDLYGGTNNNASNATEGSIIGQAKTATNNANSATNTLKTTAYGTTSGSPTNYTGSSLLGTTYAAIDRANNAAAIIERDAEILAGCEKINATYDANSKTITITNRKDEKSSIVLPQDLGFGYMLTINNGIYNSSTGAFSALKYDGWKTSDQTLNLAKVATSGSYSHLSDKPSIGNGTVTITQNGVVKKTFTMNQSDNATIALTDTNTTYSAGDGISLSGTTFSNSGVRSVGAGSANGTVSVNTNGTAKDVAVKGLGSAAYTNSSAYATASHTHNYAGSSSAGGAAYSANKLNTSAGSGTQPVYFSNGVPVACSYTLGKSVPFDAVFTDTNTTYSLATTSAAGLMSKSDYSLLHSGIYYGTSYNTSGKTDIGSGGTQVCSFSSEDAGTYLVIGTATVYDVAPLNGGFFVSLYSLADKKIFASANAPIQTKEEGNNGFGTATVVGRVILPSGGGQVGLIVSYGGHTSGNVPNFLSPEYSGHTSTINAPGATIAAIRITT